MQTIQPQYDVLIAGGGMVGASAALALAPLGLRIAVVEPRPVQSATQPSYDDRVTALSAGSQRILKAINVWPRLAADATPIHHIHVSDRGHAGFTRLHAEQEQVAALGYIVPNKLFGTHLHAALAERDNIDMLCPASVDDIALDNNGANVTIGHDDTTTVTRAQLVIASDGARSPLRERVGIQTTQRDYNQTAIIANLTPERGHHNWAYERFTSTGAVAMLPMSRNRVGTVWVAPNEAAHALIALDDDAFINALQHAFGYRLGHFTQVGQRVSYPLKLTTADQQVGQRIAIIGNSAHSLHPIAGQGFNLSLRDVAALAETLNDAVTQGHDIGAHATLERYAQQRRRDQRITIGLTNGLLSAFCTPFRPLAKLRNLGLLGLDLCPPAKRVFARQTMGLAGRKPRLPS